MHLIWKTQTKTAAKMHTNFCQRVFKYLDIEKERKWKIPTHFPGLQPFHSLVWIYEEIWHMHKNVKARETKRIRLGYTILFDFIIPQCIQMLKHHISSHKHIWFWNINKIDMKEGENKFKIFYTWNFKKYVCVCVCMHIGVCRRQSGCVLDVYACGG